MGRVKILENKLIESGYICSYNPCGDYMNIRLMFRGINVSFMLTLYGDEFYIPMEDIVRSFNCSIGNIKDFNEISNCRVNVKLIRSEM